MSTFEKIIIPLVDENIWINDLTSYAGFIDSYTSDPDKPSGEPELFLMYKNDKKNDYSTKRMMRFESSKYLKRVYVKYINGEAFYVYSFWIKPEIKNLYSGVVNLSTKQKARILQFWGPCSLVDTVFENYTCLFDVKHSITPEDFRESAFDKVGLRITKKGTAS